MKAGVASEEQGKEAIVIRVNLHEYLAQLQAQEYARPVNARRDVPSVADLVRAIGVNKASLYNWAGNEYNSTRHDILAAIINELRARGFSASINDLLTEHPASTVPEK